MTSFAGSVTVNVIYAHNVEFAPLKGTFEGFKYIFLK